jgi:uncharacterized small protein (TIGR04563 family)
MTLDKRKQTLYLPDDILHEVQDEAQRLDRSMSWLIQTAWRIARDEIAAIPSQFPRMPV